jgi:hypothetical protein
MRLTFKTISKYSEDEINLILSTYKNKVPTDYLDFIRTIGIATNLGFRDITLSSPLKSLEINEIYKFNHSILPFCEESDGNGFYVFNLSTLKNGKADIYILSNQEFVEAGCYPDYSLQIEGLDYNSREAKLDYSKDSSYFYPTKYKSFDEWLAAIDDEDFELIL